MDIVPLFLGTASDVQITDEDLIISSPSLLGEGKNLAEPSVCIQHVPTGIIVQSAGASCFSRTHYQYFREYLAHKHHGLLFNLFLAFQ